MGNNIDNLFNEQLKNLAVTPNKKVWNTIEGKLKKKQRKILPFWWFSSAIAAIFIIGLLVYPLFNNTKTKKNNDAEVIITNLKEDKVELKKEFDSLFINKNNKKETLIANDKTNIKQNNNKLITIKEPIIAKTNNYKSENKKELVGTKNTMKNIFLADNSRKIYTDSLSNKKIKTDKKTPENITEKDFFTIKNKKIDKKEQIKKTDLNNFINKKETVIDKKTTKKQWSISPVFAVLNSNSFSNTSPIDKDLSNTTKGENNFSYGVKVAYKLNGKWSVQSGIHLQKISYTNTNIIVTAASYSTSTSAIFSNQTVFSFKGNKVSEKFNFAANSLTNTVSSNGTLSQNYNYIEIPMEVKYNFFNTKKFETQLVVGFSSLFLNKNEINLTTNDFFETGNADNLSNINFSGNLGLDFNYNFNKNWSINVNPMFKAQLNTFNKNSNGFSPFNIGVYSGFKYSF